MASYNTCGKTLHSILQLHVKPTKQKDLQASALQCVQVTMKQKHYLIIDEMSMIGQCMYAWVDRRLRQATASNWVVYQSSFLAQLPPVGRSC